MSLSDPIADMLTRIRNAGNAGHSTCAVSGDKIKKSILEILKSEGFIKDFQVVANNSFNDFQIELKYAGIRKPVIQT
ncbi:MAG: 30S ribosomal protein S8, partial [Leptospira sp.]|nr:30S ribosomal protein S8 [Leptospira sp.]